MLCTPSHIIYRVYIIIIFSYIHTYVYPHKVRVQQTIPASPGHSAVYTYTYISQGHYNDQTLYLYIV